MLLTTPVPFPLVQMTTTIVWLYVFTLPFVLLSDDNSTLIAHCITIFIITYGYVTFLNQKCIWCSMHIWELIRYSQFSLTLYIVFLCFYLFADLLVLNWLLLNWMIHLVMMKMILSKSTVKNVWFFFWFTKKTCSPPFTGREL